MQFPSKREVRKGLGISESKSRDAAVGHEGIPFNERYNTASKHCTKKCGD